jgi:hypothetical protein
MAPSWPASLWDIQFLPITYQPINERIVTPFDNGLTKVRRVSSRFLFRFTFETFLTGEQFTVFRDFFNTDLESGSLPFEWENPLSNAVRTMRFQPKADPPWTMELLHSAASPNDRLYKGTMSMETI